MYVVIIFNFNRNLDNNELEDLPAGVFDRLTQLRRL